MITEAQAENLFYELIALHQHIVVPAWTDLLVPGHPDTTAADVEIERRFQRVCETCLGLDFTFIGEESGGHRLDLIGPASDIVFVDPIDGTSMLLNGDGGYACTFAVVSEGKLFAGGTYLPLEHDPLFFIRNVTPTLRPSGGGTHVVIGHVDQAMRPQLRSALETRGFTVGRLGSTARRFVEVARGETMAIVKTIGWSETYPRLWGSAAGLIACDQARVPLWYNAESRTVCAGPSEFMPLLLEFAPGFAPIELDDLYRALWVKPDPSNGVRRLELGLLPG